MTTPEIRVRIAPSPTGYFHVGTARAAIFNWLFARHHGGKFLVRIEDTDRDRSQQHYADCILNGLRWLGCDWDEEVVYQSSRMHTFRPLAMELMQHGKAYRCFCSADELAKKREAAQAAKATYCYDGTCRDLSAEVIRQKLEAGNPFVVRLRMPQAGVASFDDEVLGKIERDYRDLDDFIILKSDGNAIYNFAVVIDDHEMGISHVIRGNDHVNNTFLQAETYRAFGWPLPVFAHLPMILRKSDRSKLSKRKGDKSVDEYQREGFLPEAMLNFLALLGWSPKDDREKMTRRDLIDAFSLEGVIAANAVFDPEKLTWLNGEYIREKSDHELATLIAPLLVEAGVTTKYYLETRWHWFLKVIGLLKERCKLLTDFAQISGYFFTDDFAYDQQGAAKSFSAQAAEHLERLAERFGKLTDFTETACEQSLRGLAEELGVKPAALIHPTRLAVTGLTGGPSLFALLEVIGKERVLARLRRAIDYCRAGVPHS